MLRKARLASATVVAHRDVSQMKPHQEQRAFRPGRHGIGVPVVIALCLLLAIPGYALSQLTAQIDWRVLVGAPLALSIFTFFAYRSDKLRAEAGEWRVPEATLHFAALVGGWPGAFLAQRRFRHKTSKVSFQVVFWIVVLTHQFLAVDSLLDWRITKDAVRAIKSQTAQQGVRANDRGFHVSCSEQPGAVVPQS